MATKKLAALTVDLIGRGDSLRAELARTNKQTKSWGASMRKQVSASGKAFAGMGAAAGAAAIGGMAMLYNSVSKTEDALGKFSDRIGETPEKITALRHAAELTGVSAGKLDSSLERMVKRLGEAQNGSGEARKYLEQMGVATADFFAMSPAEQFKTISDQINQYETQSQKAAAAAAIFGREGVALVNTMAMGSEGIAEVEQRVDALGLSLSRLDIAKIEAANDAMFEAEQLTGAFGKTLTAELAPFVTALSKDFKQAAIDAGGFGQIATKAVDSVIDPILFVADAIAGIGRVFSVVKSTLKTGFAAIGAMLLRLYEGYAKVASFFNIPGADKAVEDLEYFREKLDKTAIEGAYETREAFSNMLNDALPSAKVRPWLARARDLAEETARVTVEAGEKARKDAQKKTGGDDALKTRTQKGGGEAAKVRQENAKILAAQRERFEQSITQRLEAEGNLEALERVRYAKEQARFEQEKQTLIDRGLVTAEIEAQLRIQRENAEAEHQERVKNIQKAQAMAALENTRMVMQGTSELFGNMADLTKAFGKEQSKSYKAMFAISKGFAIADAAIKIQQGLASAWSDGFPAGIPAAAMVLSQTAGIISSIKGQNFAGAYEQGGIVPGTSYSGDNMTAAVNSGEMILNKAQQGNLFNLANGQGGGAAKTTVNLRIINLFDAALIADYMATPDGEEAVLNVVRDNPELVKQLVA